MNPPRRAKRPRLDTDPVALHPSASTSANPPPPRSRPQLLPKGDDLSPHQLNDSPEYHSSDEEEDDYDPGEPAPAPKRRGRKPGPMSRTARESQRKLNHSRIEKARRTKINETLATLSNLVSDVEKQGVGSPHEEVPAKKERCVNCVAFYHNRARDIDLRTVRAKRNLSLMCSSRLSHTSRISLTKSKLWKSKLTPILVDAALRPRLQHTPLHQNHFRLPVLASNASDLKSAIATHLCATTTPSNAAVTLIRTTPTLILELLPIHLARLRRTISYFPLRLLVRLVD